MGLISYTRDIPFATNNPSTDQPDMQTNNNHIDDILKIDHVSFNTVGTQNGYHTVIHQAAQVADPAAIAGIGQTYVKTVSGDQELFFESGNGIVTQLTGPDLAQAATNGYTWLPGGILLQWGRVTGAFVSGDTGTVIFATSNISFPTNCFIVTVSLGHTGTKPPEVDSFSVKSASVNKLSFDWAFRGDGPFGLTAITTMFWVAIGN